MVQNFKVLHWLLPGCQGNSYVVESNSDQKQYVMKCIECPDENHCNKVFRQLLEVRDVDHYSVCKIEDMFVSWENTISAIQLNVVTEYASFGDLSCLLLKKRASQEMVDEAILVKWLGQLIDVIDFIHQRNIIHRDLKAPNLLVRDDLSLMLCDFAVPAIMADLKTRTRKPSGLENEAPEVSAGSPFTVKSDIWALGIVLLDMATTSLLSREELSECLASCRTDGECFHSVMTTMTNVYSSDLCDLIRNMLNIDPEQRPSTSDLYSDLFIRKCLEAAGLSQTARPKLSTAGSGGRPSSSSESKTDSQTMLRQLSDLASLQDVQVTDEEKRMILDSLLDPVSDMECHKNSIQIIHNLAISAGLDDEIFESSTLAAILSILQTYTGVESIVHLITQLFVAFTANESILEPMGRLGAIRILLDILETYKTDAVIVTNICKIIWSLGLNSFNATKLCREDSVSIVTAVLVSNKTDVQATGAAIAALLTLSLEEENRHKFRENNVVSQLLTSVQMHPKDPVILRNTCMTLSNMAENDEHSAYTILTCSEVDGLPLIIQSYTNHKDNPEVVEAICMLFSELSNYDDILDELIALGIEEMLKESKLNYAGLPEIAKPACKVLEKLANHE